MEKVHCLCHLLILFFGSIYHLNFLVIFVRLLLFLECIYQQYSQNQSRQKILECPKPSQMSVADPICQLSHNYSSCAMQMIFPYILNKLNLPQFMGFPSKLWFLYTFTSTQKKHHLSLSLFFESFFSPKNPSFRTNFPPFLSGDQGTWKQPKPIRTRRRWYPASKVWTFRDDVRRCELSRWTKQKTQELRFCWLFWCVFLLRMGSTILIRLFDFCVLVFELNGCWFGQLTWFSESPANYRGFKCNHDERKKKTPKQHKSNSMKCWLFTDRICARYDYKPQACICHLNAA